MQDKKVLVTGVTGMVGSIMVDWILENKSEYKIIACKRRHSHTENIKHLLNNPRIEWVFLSLDDPHQVNNVIERYKPEKIFHIAGQSFVKESWDSPAETLATNTSGAINLLEAVRRFSPDSTILLVGTSEEYGMVYDNEVPIKETNPLRPLSPYGVSKMAQEYLGYVYYMSYGLKVVLTRAFNHFCHRRGVEFFESKAAKQTAEMHLGMRTKYSFGNLDAKRDFTNAWDVVRAYWELSEKGEYGTPYNICSGKVFTMKEVLDILANLAGIEDYEFEVDQNSLRPGKADVPLLLGDCSKAEAVIGEKISKIELEDSLKDLLHRWLDELKNIEGEIG